jgi:hypothetical protein
VGANRKVFISLWLCLTFAAKSSKHWGCELSGRFKSVKKNAKGAKEGAKVRKVEQATAKQNTGLSTPLRFGRGDEKVGVRGQKENPGWVARIFILLFLL